MSRDVDFSDVCHRVREFGERATLITVTADGLPHVVTAIIAIDPDRLRARVGPRTRANLTVRPQLTLTWEPRDAGEYQLILDGVVDDIGTPNDGGVGEIAIDVERGILHRLAELPEPGPSCLALGS